MKKTIYILVILVSLLALGNPALVYGAKSQTISSLPLTGIIDIDDRSYNDYFTALQKDGTIWIGNDDEPAIRGPRIAGAVKVAGNLALTSSGEVWRWSTDSREEPKRLVELSNIRDISVGPANMALNDKGQVYAWGNACLISLMRPDFQERKEGQLCFLESEAAEEDIVQANIPKLAVENVKAIKASHQSLIVLKKDGKTLNRYGHTYVFELGMVPFNSTTPVIDFVGYDSDAVTHWDVLLLSDKGLVSGLPKETFQQFSVSYEGYYSLYLNKDGSVWGAAAGTEGAPQRIPALKNIVEVHAVALNSGTALDKNGIVWTWGNRHNMPYNGKPDKLATKISAKPVSRQLSLKVDGTYIASNPGPIQMNGVTFVPIRALMESIGAKVTYVNDQITVSYQDQVLQMKVYDKSALLNGKKIQMPAAATSHGGRTFVPVRFIAEAFGAEVKWDAIDASVLVQFPSKGANK